VEEGGGSSHMLCVMEEAVVRHEEDGDEAITHSS
jgi:hypothetical protein